MKLAELFHKPTSNAAQAHKGVIFDNGDLVITADGEPGQVMSAPDAEGCYQVKLKKNSETIRCCGSDLKLAASK